MRTEALENSSARSSITSSTAAQLLAPREGVRQFTAPNEWVATAQALLGSTAAPVTLVCGGKDVGKSSLTRYLVNALLNRCEVLVVSRTAASWSLFLAH